MNQSVCYTKKTPVIKVGLQNPGEYKCVEQIFGLFLFSSF